MTVKCQSRNKMPIQHKAKGRSRQTCDRNNNNHKSHKFSQSNSSGIALAALSLLLLAAHAVAARVDNAKLENQIKLLINDDELLLQQRNPLEADTSNIAAADANAEDPDHFQLYRSELKRLSYETIHRILRDENEPLYRREDAELRYYQKRSYQPTHEVVRRAVPQQPQQPPLKPPTHALKLSHRHLRAYNASRDFHGVASDITTLDLSHNQLLTPQLSLDAFNALQQLNLAHNTLTALPLPANDTSLVKLNLNGNRISKAAAPRNFHLRELHLAANEISQLAQLNLSMLSALETLDLSCNRIAELETAFFPQRMHKLKHLNLAHNRLGTIYRETFYNLLSLNTLLLTHNNITDIDYETFLALPNLQYLDLSHNQLLGESIRALQGIPDLVRLSIAYNPEVGAAMQEFVASWSLKELDASGTGLCQIPAALAQSVRTLKLTDNWLKIINCGDLDSYPLLQYLDLSHSHIEDIEDDALGRLEILEVLFLDHNQLRKVPLSLPTSLEHLFLHQNEIMDIQPQHFQALTNLQTLDLSGNKILYLPALPLPKLLTLNLRSVGLKGVNQALVHTLPRLRDLLLDENPIKCSDLLSIAEWASPCRIAERSSGPGTGNNNAIDVAGDVAQNNDVVVDSNTEADADADNQIANGNALVMADANDVGQQHQQAEESTTTTTTTTAEAAKIDLKQNFVRMHNFFEKFQSNCGAQRQIAAKATEAQPACAVELEAEGDEALKREEAGGASAEIYKNAPASVVKSESNAPTPTTMQQPSALAAAAMPQLLQFNQQNFTAEMAAAAAASSAHDYRANGSRKPMEIEAAATTKNFAQTGGIATTAMPPIRSANKLATAKTLQQVATAAETKANQKQRTAAGATKTMSAATTEAVAESEAASTALGNDVEAKVEEVLVATAAETTTEAVARVRNVDAADRKTIEKAGATGIPELATTSQHLITAQPTAKSSGKLTKSGQNSVAYTAQTETETPVIMRSQQKFLLETAHRLKTTSSSNEKEVLQAAAATVTHQSGTIEKLQPENKGNVRAATTSKAAHVRQIISTTLGPNKDNRDGFDASATRTEATTAAAGSEQKLATNMLQNDQPAAESSTATAIKTPAIISLLSSEPIHEIATAATAKTLTEPQRSTTDSTIEPMALAARASADVEAGNGAVTPTANNDSHKVQSNRLQHQAQLLQWLPTLQHNSKRANPHLNDIAGANGRRFWMAPSDITGTTTAPETATATGHSFMVASTTATAVTTTARSPPGPAVHQRHEPLQLHLKDRHLIGTPLLMHHGQNVLVEAGAQLKAQSSDETTTALPRVVSSTTTQALRLANSQLRVSSDAFEMKAQLQKRLENKPSLNGSRMKEHGLTGAAGNIDEQTQTSATNTTETKALPPNDSAGTELQLHSVGGPAIPTTATAKATTTTTFMTAVPPHNTIKQHKATANSAAAADFQKKPSLIMKKMTFTTTKHAQPQQQHHQQHYTLNTPRENEAVIERRRSNAASAAAKQNSIVAAKQINKQQLTAKVAASTSAAVEPQSPHKHNNVNTAIAGTIGLEHVDGELLPHKSQPQQQITPHNTDSNHSKQQEERPLVHGQSIAAAADALKHAAPILKSEQWLDVRHGATGQAHPAVVLLLSFGLFIVLLVGLLHVYRCEMPWRRHFGTHQQRRPHHQRQLNEDDANSFLNYANGQQALPQSTSMLPRWHHSTRTQPPYASPLHNLHVRELQKTAASVERQRYYDFNAVRTEAAANRSGSETSHSASSSRSSTHSSAMLDADETFYIEMTPEVATVSANGGSGVGGCDMLPMELLSVSAATCKQRDQAARDVTVTGAIAKTTTMNGELMGNSDGGSNKKLAAGATRLASARRFDLW